MKTLVVSDIHGHYLDMLAALSAAKHYQSDRLIFLGDYTDIYARDKEGSIKVLDYLMDLDNLFDHNVFIRGNHEKMLMSAMLMDPDELIPGTPEMYRQDFLERISDAHRSFLSKTLERYVEEQFIFVHDVMGMPIVPGRIIISGHFHALTPTVKKGSITIADNNKVFALDLETLKAWDSKGIEYDCCRARW